MGHLPVEVPTVTNINFHPSQEKVVRINKAITKINGK